MIRLEGRSKREARHSKILLKELDDLKRVYLLALRDNKPWTAFAKIATKTTKIQTISICTKMLI